jgi:hypothetical protein
MRWISEMCHPFQAHLVLESHFHFRLILSWISLGLVTKAGGQSRLNKQFARGEVGEWLKAAVC